MDKRIVAGIYDILCDKQKAITMYRDILANNPNDKEAEICLRRLVSKEINFDSSNINEEMYKLFLNASDSINLIKIEEWLKWMPKK